MAFLASLAACSGAALAEAPAPLTDRQEEWLDSEVVYIISDQERDVFLQLSSEELRDQFVEMFWKQRDPTPATTYNEFKEEHYRRLAYANTWYGSRRAKDGWRSDRGRIYILFGEPKERTKFTGENDIRDCEIWFYDSEGKIPDAPFFRLLFYQKSFGQGFVLYSPTQDGPQELAMQIAPTRHQALQYIWERAGQAVWEAAQTSIPTEPLGGTWSPQSELLISKIENLRNTMSDSSWAESFLITRGRVSTRLSFRNLKLSMMSRVLYNLDREAFLHTAFEIRPEDLQAGEIDGRYYTVFDVRTFVEDAATSREVISRSDHWESRFEAPGGQILAHPIAFEQVLPLVAGKYRILWIIDDLITGTFSYRQEEVTIADQASPALVLIPPVVASSYEALERSSSAELHPFRIFNIQYDPEPTGSFNRGDNLSVFFQYLFSRNSPPDGVRFEIELQPRPGQNLRPIHLEHSVPRERLGDRGILFIHRQIPVTDLATGEYDLVIRASAEGTTPLETGKIPLRYKGEAVLVRPRPDRFFPVLLLASPDYGMERVRQFQAKGESEKALAELLHALRDNPEDTALLEKKRDLESDLAKTGG